MLPLPFNCRNPLINNLKIILIINLMMSLMFDQNSNENNLE